MNVEIVRRSKSDEGRSPTQPFPATDGFIWRLVRGDYCDPILDPDGWFGATPPKVLLRYRFTQLALPFFAWKIGFWRGYCGAKVFGVDSPAYRDFLPEKDVEVGSQAFCLSARLFSTKG